MYRLLLYLFPKSFRADYGEEMVHIFAERRRLASGPLSMAALWIDVLYDVMTNAFCAHWDLLRQDLQYTRRTLLRTPGFTLTAVVVAALGIGANTAAFSIVDRVFMQPLPFRDADRLVKLWQRTPEYARMEPSPPNYRDWREMSSSFASMGAFSEAGVSLTGVGEPQQLTATAVTADVFATLGARAVLGRVFARGEDGEAAHPTVVLSHGLWQAVFGGDPAVVGRSIRLTGFDTSSYTVIGVMAPGFYFPDRETQLWMPLKIDANADRSDNYLEVIARLKPGVTLDAARAEMATVASALERAFPKENENTGVSVITLRDEMSRQSRLLLVALFGASVCVLLIACTNLANLILTRLLGRRQELAVRAAMGAGRERLVRQLLTESIALAIAGGATGVLVAAVVGPLFAKLVPLTLPIGEPATLEVRVLAFAFALTMFAAVAAGLLPAWRVCGGGDLTALRERAASGLGRRGERLRAAFVLVEVTASIVLLVASGLLVRALWRVQAVDPGFDTANVLTLHTQLPFSRYGQTDTRVQFYDRVLADVRALPGVADAAYIGFLPMVMRGGIWPVNIKGMAPVEARGAREAASLRFVTPRFFAALGIPIRLGRDVAESDTRETAFVAVVSESFVRRYWPNQDPIGRVFTFAFSERMIVGVVGDVRVRGLERESEPQVYVPYKQVPDGALQGYAPTDLVIRTAGDPLTISPAVRAIVKKADAEIPVSDVRTLEDIVAADTAPRRTQVLALAAFVIVSFVLAAVGIHGLVSFGVSRRRSEIGLRIALGAQRGDVLRAILREAFILALAGSAIGMCLAYAAGRSMEALLAGVGPADFATFAAAAALTILMTLSGSVIPALRALSVDPATTLRNE